MSPSSELLNCPQSQQPCKPQFTFPAFDHPRISLSMAENIQPGVVAKLKSGAAEPASSVLQARQRRIKLFQAT